MICRPLASQLYDDSLQHDLPLMFRHWLIAQVSVLGEWCHDGFYLLFTAFIPVFIPCLFVGQLSRTIELYFLLHDLSADTFSSLQLACTRFCFMTWAPIRFHRCNLPARDRKECSGVTYLSRWNLDIPKPWWMHGLERPGALYLFKMYTFLHNFNDGLSQDVLHIFWPI